MSKPTRKELSRRLDLVEHETDVLAAQLRAAQKVLLRLDPEQQPTPTRTRPPREVVRRPWPLRWWDQLTGLWGCSWVILAVAAAPVAAALAGRWWL